MRVLVFRKHLIDSSLKGAYNHLGKRKQRKTDNTQKIRQQEADPPHSLPPGFLSHDPLSAR